MSKQMKPTIRFSGFTDDWEELELRECFDERQERSADGELISVTINEGIKRFSELGRHDNSSADKSHYKKVEIGDIAYNSMRMWQGASGYSPYSGILSPAYTVITPKSGTDSKYFAYCLKTLKMIHIFQLNSQGITSDTWNLKYPAFSVIETAVPKVDEQKQIALLFTHLDHIINLHQHKYDKLLTVKKSMLEKMFPKDGADVPEIRFKGFSGAWEKHKLGDLVERVVRKNLNNECSLPLTISAQYGLIDQITYFNNRIASRDVSNYYLVLNGEFAYNKSTSDGFPFGAVKRLDLYEKGVLSTLYIVFSIKNYKSVNSDFLSVFFDTDRWHKGVSERATEGARNHGLLNISAEDFFDIDLYLPKDDGEQAKIGAYMKQLYSLINVHQKELDKLQNIKKALLEKMFA
ncbi:type I restriction enzyme S subunit [Hydrogenoanaerobacterium saccharovorans]|uniref:Type I restriction enzyme, S subunit n=1 Tax=Hydrogenoanaerobacterium saccharovorans TaxID=474960 RepID=A0A1H8ANN2_9FIRM|nr:restriction endonuclease subunit S [Hydrogenoanaerobacterium saccharovorans]RPF47837.1 type I restriction enzyme S subunit [Hydrogenoanaerobacterium saccharovorans]SEM72291.1 type I restriction enzyme, S subunit [Hydrogenoanaerobacterium saccharovorans]